jgi:hypothetical protein
LKGLLLMMMAQEEEGQVCGGDIRMLIDDEGR